MHAARLVVLAFAYAYTMIISLRLTRVAIDDCLRPGGGGVEWVFAVLLSAMTVLWGLFGFQSLVEAYYQ